MEIRGRPERPGVKSAQSKQARDDARERKLKQNSCKETEEPMHRVQT